MLYPFAVFYVRPRQLPPTVICPEAEDGGLGMSVFSRLMHAGIKPILLDKCVSDLHVFLLYLKRPSSPWCNLLAEAV